MKNKLINATLDSMLRITFVAMLFIGYFTIYTNLL